MSLHLTLLVLRHETDLDHCVVEPLSTIRLDQDYGMFSRIQRPNGDSSQDDPETPRSEDVKVSALPQGLKIWFRDYAKEATRCDKYGKELTHTTPSELRKIADVETTSINKAAMAYIQALPQNLPVVLYWH